MSHVLAPPVGGVDHRNPANVKARVVLRHRPVIAHVAGCAVGGLAFGAGLLALQVLFHLVPLTAVVAAAAVIALGAARPGFFNVWAGPRLQVPEAWLAQANLVPVAARWGVLLGAGVVTRFNTSLLPLGVGAALAQPYPVAAFVFGLSYGLARGGAVPLDITRHYDRHALHSPALAPCPRADRRRYVAQALAIAGGACVLVGSV